MSKMIIPAESFDVYQIQVSPFMFRKKLKEYVQNELEKIHPLFNDRTCFKMKRIYRDGKIFVKVFVLENDFLEDESYKSDSYFMFENEKGKFYFTDTKKKFPFVLTSVISLLVLSVSSCISFFSKNSPSTSLNDQNQFVKEEFEMNDLLINEFKLFTESVVQANGVCTSLNFNNSYFEACVNEVMPYELYLGNSSECNSRVLTANYEEPKTCKIRYEVNNFSESNKTFLSHDLSQFFLGFENVIKKSNGKKIVEDYDQCSISFQIYKSDLKSCFDFINDYLLKSELAIDELFVNIEELIADVCFTFCNCDFESTSLFSVLCLQSDLFGINIINEFDAKKDSAKANASEVFTNDINKFLGKVIDKNGLSILFYKTKDGNIKGVFE